MAELDPPCVLVTGAAKRLGRSIALALAERGWRVAVHYHESDAQAAQTAADCSALTPGAAIFRADLGQESHAANLVAQVLGVWGRLDAVVHSASVFEYDNADSFSYAALTRHQQINTGAAVLLARALHQHLLTQSPASPRTSAQSTTRGALVVLLDQKLWNLNPDFFSYTLSKAALHSAVTLLAQHYAPHLRVVGVAPGLTLPSNMLSEQRFAQLHAQAPLGRASQPDEVAQTVVFALQNAALTGTTIVVDGGQHLMKFERDFSLM